MAQSKSTLLWGGRFTGGMDEVMVAFNESLPFDRVLYAADIDASIAYAKALRRASLLTTDEESTLVRGLGEVAAEWERGAFAIQPSMDEDIHTANERRLGEMIGAKIAGKLHTGRSRNEQIATDLRLWLRAQLAELRTLLCAALETCARRAAEEVDALMPGYTHLQRAQPVRFAHWLLSHATYLLGDLQRLEGVMERVNACTLGVGALSGNPFGLDRAFLARELGFVSVHPNSLAAVADRDFVVETIQWAALLMAHLSRLAEDLILYSTAEFGFVRVADAYSTGSSLMPQKKNPDSLELIRGKAGRVVGQSTGILVTIKSLPTAYNKDLQESVEPLLDCIKTVNQSLKITGGIISTLHINKKRMRDALTVDMLATELADYLVKKGLPFRETHHMAGAVVKKAEDADTTMDQLKLEDFKAICPKFEADVHSVFDFDNAVEKRTSSGGTSKNGIMEQVKEIMAILKEKASTEESKA